MEGGQGHKGDLLHSQAHSKTHGARKDAEKAVYENITNQMSRENVDVMGDKPVRNDAGEVSLSEEAKQEAWLERLLNVEFEWNPEHISDEPPLE